MRHQNRNHVLPAIPQHPGHIERKRRISPLVRPQQLPVQPHRRKVIRAVKDQPAHRALGLRSSFEMLPVPPLPAVHPNQFFALVKPLLARISPTATAYPRNRHRAKSAVVKVLRLSPSLHAGPKHQTTPCANRRRPATHPPRRAGASRSTLPSTLHRLRSHSRANPHNAAASRIPTPQCRIIAPSLIIPHRLRPLHVPNLILCHEISGLRRQSSLLQAVPE